MLVDAGSVWGRLRLTNPSEKRVARLVWIDGWEKVGTLSISVHF
jgi:hypothetical protein